MTIAMATESFDKLTHRERDVVDQMVLYGNTTNKAIAAALVVSERTVHTHMLNIFRKLDIHDRSSLCMAYLRHLNQRRNQ